MPSNDEHDLVVWQGVREPLDAFRSALNATLEQIRGTLEAQRSPSEPDDTLGRFASGRIDSERFTSLLLQKQSLDARAVQCIEDAYRTLGELSAQKEDLFLVRVESGQPLRDAVSWALARLGTAFGAARVFDLARSGHYKESEHGTFLEQFPFERWNRAERDNAPPLVVYVDGSDLFGADLARFLDGSLKLALVVRGRCAQAPLVRLISPGIYVRQTNDPAALAGLGAFRGTGVAALVPDESARFTHDPAAGANSWERITVDFLPEKLPPRVGAYSARQQVEEARQLSALAEKPERPAPAPAAGAAPLATTTAGDPVDQLASLLLGNAQLEDL